MDANDRFPRRYKTIMKPSQFCLPLAFALQILAALPHVYASEFHLRGPQFHDDGRIIFTVSAEVTSDTDAFGFDLAYDPAVLTFLGFGRGPLLGKGFHHLMGREVSPGNVRIGGMDVGGNVIPANSSGELVHLTFQLHNACQVTLALFHPKDDLEEALATAYAADLSTNLSSLIQVLKITSGLKETPNPCLSDISGDSRIGLEEAIHILRKTILVAP